MRRRIYEIPETGQDGNPVTGWLRFIMNQHLYCHTPPRIPLPIRISYHPQHDDSTAPAEIRYGKSANPSSPANRQPQAKPPGAQGARMRRRIYEIPETGQDGNPVTGRLRFIMNQHPYCHTPPRIPLPIRISYHPQHNKARPKRKFTTGKSAIYQAQQIAAPRRNRPAHRGRGCDDGSTKSWKPGKPTTG